MNARLSRRLRTLLRVEALLVFVAVGTADITRFPDHPGCVEVAGLIFPSLSVGCGEYRVSPER